MRAQFAGRLFASETWPSAFPRPGFCFGNRWGRAWFVGGDPRRRPTWAAHSKPLALLPRLTKMGHDEITMKVPWEYLKQSIIQSINLWRYHESKSINYIINQLIDHSFNSSIYLRKYQVASHVFPWNNHNLLTSEVYLHCLHLGKRSQQNYEDWPHFRAKKK